MPTWLAILIGLIVSFGIVVGAVRAGIALQQRARRRRATWLPHPANHQPQPSLPPQSPD